MAPFPNFQNESMSTRVKRYPCSTAQDAKLKAKNKDSKASGWKDGNLQIQRQLHSRESSSDDLQEAYSQGSKDL
jgi:hypothetical protein